MTILATSLTWLAKHPEIVDATLSYGSVAYFFWINYRERQPPRNSRWQYALWALREKVLFAAWDHPGFGLKKRWPKVLGPAPEVPAPPPLEPPNDTPPHPGPSRSSPR